MAATALNHGPDEGMAIPARARSPSQPAGMARDAAPIVTPRGHRFWPTYL